MLTASGEFGNEQLASEDQEIQYSVSIISAELDQILNDDLTSSMIATFIQRLAKLSIAGEKSLRNTAIESFFPRYSIKSSFHPLKGPLMTRAPYLRFWLTAQRLSINSALVKMMYKLLVLNFDVNNF